MIALLSQIIRRETSHGTLVRSRGHILLLGCHFCYYSWTFGIFRKNLYNTGSSWAHYVATPALELCAYPFVGIIGTCHHIRHFLFAPLSMLPVSQKTMNAIGTQIAKWRIAALSIMTCYPLPLVKGRQHPRNSDLTGRFTVGLRSLIRNTLCFRKWCFLLHK